jgi:hypothetical protein
VWPGAVCKVCRKKGSLEAGDNDTMPMSRKGLEVEVTGQPLGQIKKREGWPRLGAGRYSQGN